MKKLVSAVMSVVMLITLTSCMGFFKEVEYAQIPARQEAEKKSCSDVQYDLTKKYFEVKKGKDQIKLRNVCNVVFGVTGVFLFFPFLFVIDPTRKDNVNYANRVYEYNYLIDLAEEKECSIGGHSKIYPSTGYWGN